MLTGGVDVGSLATKAVIVEIGQRTSDSGHRTNDKPQAQVRSPRSVVRGPWSEVGSARIPTGPRPVETGREALEAALAAAHVAHDDLAAIVATGYGRETFARDGLAQAAVTEISCAARGAHLLDPSVRTVVDIGGQDSKVVRLDEDGYPTDFALNDRCAAGTGRFLEVMAEALGTTVAQLDELALSAVSPAKITRTCTVFAESEVVGLMARGVEPSRIAAGLCRVIAERTAHLAEQVGVQPPVMLAGGVGHNRAIAAELAEVLGTELLVAEEPHLVVALGAAAIAAGSHASRPGALAAGRG